MEAEQRRPSQAARRAIFAALVLSCGSSHHRSPPDAGAAGTPAIGGRSGAGGEAARAGAGAGGRDGGRGGTAGSAGHAQSGRAGQAGAAGSAAGTGGGTGGHSGSAAAGTGGITENGGRSGSGEAGESGTSNAGQGGGTPGPLGPLIDAFCSTARTCCASAGMPPGPLVECEQGFSGQVDTVALLAKGTVTLDDSAFAACVAAYEAASKSCVLTTVVEACHGLFRGTLADGAPCSDAFECDRSAGPKICLKLQNSANPNIGVCQTPPRGTSGTPCLASCGTSDNCSTTVSNPDDTVPLAFCYEADGLYCPLGDACAPLVANGAGCEWNEACGSDGFCDSTCASIGHLGDPCQFNFGCGSGLVCDSGFCVAEPVANDEICAGSPPSLD